MNEDVERVVQRAEQAARLATALLEHPGFSSAMSRLETAYLGQFRTSSAADTGLREGAYFMIAALDALRQDLATTIAGGAITARNLRNRR